MTKYLGYVAGGQCRDTHAPVAKEEGKPVRVNWIRKQFWVVEELRRIGVTAWCGKRMEFKRLSGDRDWTAFDVPALPNYIVMDLDDHNYFAATQIDHLSSTLMAVPKRDLIGGDGVLGLQGFMDDADSAYKAAQRINSASRDEVTQYNEGQRLRAISGPLKDMLVTFERMVDANRVSARTDRGMPVVFDAFDVEGAG